jgi:hypothetical protein
MHYCDFHTLLALAQCSRFHFASADSDFAWKFIPFRHFNSNKPHLARLLTSSLIRHAPISTDVECPSGGSFSSVEKYAAHLSDLEFIPQLQQIKLDDYNRMDGSTFWEVVLSHRALRHVTSLSIDHNEWSMELYSILLRHMSVKLRHLFLAESNDLTDSIGHLFELPSLTHLHVEDSRQPSSTGPFIKAAELWCAGLHPQAE